MNVYIPMDRKALLFGLQDKASTSVENYIILYVKYYIWKTKFQSKLLDFRSFRTFLKNKLEDLKRAYNHEEKDYRFEPLVLIYDSLLRNDF